MKIQIYKILVSGCYYELRDGSYGQVIVFKTKSPLQLQRASIYKKIFN